MGAVHLPVFGFAGARAAHAQSGGASGQYHPCHGQLAGGRLQLDLWESLADTEPGVYADPSNPQNDSQSWLITDSHFDSVNTAIFGALDGVLDQRWHWNLGARAERRTADYHDVSNDLDDPDPLYHDFAPVNHLWGGNASLEYQVQAGQNLYVSVGRGYKAGGFNLGRDCRRTRSCSSPNPT